MVIIILTYFRTSDAKMIANYKVQAELTAIESTEDGRCIALGTVDGCLSVLAICDSEKDEMRDFLVKLPSRDVKVCNLIYKVQGLFSYMYVSHSLNFVAR